MLFRSILKTFVASWFFGTYDMDQTYVVARVMEKGITTNIYSHFWLYNNPPTWAIVTYLVNQLSKITSIAFSTLIKFPLIIFDVLVALLLYKMVEKASKKERFRVVASFLYNPITIMVSAYGAQFDIVAIYFLLLYCYIIKKNEKIVHQLIYGFSIAVKLVTIFPIIFFMSRQKGFKKILLPILAALPFIVIILPYIPNGWENIKGRLLNYTGIWGFWGYSRPIQYLTTYFGLYDLQLILKFWLSKAMIIVMFGLMLYYFNKFKKISILEGVKISYLFFFVLSPGFGVQYIVWILPFAILQKNHFYYVYSLFGSLVVFLFYYGHGISNLFIREVLTFSVVAPFMWIFCIYWFFRMHSEIKTRQT